MSHPRTSAAAHDHPIRFEIGRAELAVRRRYETLSICNDVCSGLLFLVGSFFFFSDRLVYAGTWMFVIGSVLMLIRPTIRLARRLHLRRFHGGGAAPGHESSFDF